LKRRLKQKLYCLSSINYENKMHHRQHIADMPVILHRKGVAFVLASPGSRNALLINSFLRVFGWQCISIVDERSAAYVALGIASFSKKAVVLLCTSGTAALNYAPALAEAFHLGVPLIAITADRPPEWIDQQDNQTIHQEGLYNPNIKASFSMPVEVVREAELWHANRIINEAFNCATSGRPGPVHINVPLREPLYEEIPAAGDVHCIRQNFSLAFNETGDSLKNVWRHAGRILLVAGQQAYNEKLMQLLVNLSRDERISIIGEPLSNVRIPGIIQRPELLLARRDDNHDLDPDLLLYFGGPVVSNRLKQFLRHCNLKNSWFIDTTARHVDTFRHLTDVIAAGPVQFFEWVLTAGRSVSSDYRLLWQEHDKQLQDAVQTMAESFEFSDLGIMHRISAVLPEKAVVFAGNSGIVRYIGFFPPRCREIYANRGTSGIDGCVSTAVGIALAARETVIALVGDQSFVYDSNALWNRALPDNLKVVVVNNQGGGIFSMLDGPSVTPAFKSYLEAHHPAEIAELCAAFNVNHHKCNGYDDFDDSFKNIIRQKGPSVYEILTPREVNTVVFRNFVSQLKKPQ